ncbi:hypothetical protein EC912_1015 [Luteibacter rhizovicinus]|uniref:Uncharacterized protein n=1 Tax=Luteibacter rhizovicinus TaxID=242606 RepID=A0A4R3Z013_9GAMM|nr:hypothetical protein [Luteibacter rhizovicinus]TCV97013.1 hypothetical protein EC912_1015 [Luteibacter rhizovicinus]
MTPVRFLPLACSLAVAPAIAAESRDMAMAPICAGIAKSRPADPEGIIQVMLVAKPRAGTLPADLKLELREPSGRTEPVALDTNHSFDPRCDVPGRPESVVRINYPKARVNFGMVFPARVPPGTQMSYAKLAESVPVMQEAIRLQAGVFRFFAPKVRGIRLIFPAAGQTATVDTPGGPKTFAADHQGIAIVPWNPDWATAQVTLSSPLKGIAPDMK